MTLFPRLHPVLCLLLVVAGSACMRSEADPEAGSTRLSGLITRQELDELSGMAASPTHADLLWAMNDGGNPARLHALRASGAWVASLPVQQVPATDWEDMAAFRYRENAWLLIADTGDNGGLRKTLQLHVLPEPLHVQDGQPLAPAWSVVFRWPDGPRDCEAVAVDPATETVLLFTKRRQPVEVYRVPLAAAPRDGIVIAQRIGHLQGLPQGSAAHTHMPQSHQVTGASLSPDGRRLAVLTYSALLVYTRQGDQDWADAIATTPKRIPIPLVPQAEAVAWTRDGTGVFVTGEFHPAPLFHVRP